MKKCILIAFAALCLSFSVPATTQGQLMSEFAEEMIQLHARQKAEIERLHAKHKTEIERLYAKHKTEMQRLFARHRTEEKTLRAKHKGIDVPPGERGGTKVGDRPYKLPPRFRKGQKPKHPPETELDEPQKPDKP